MAFDDIQDVNQPLEQEQQLQDENQIQQNTDNISLPVIDLDQAEQQDPPTKAQKLYRHLISAKKQDGTSKYTIDDLGSEDEFSTAISDSAKADKIYSRLVSDGYTIDDIGDKNEFLTTFVTQKKNDGKDLQAGTTTTSQSGLQSQSNAPKGTNGQLVPIPPTEKEIDPNDLFAVAKKAKTLKSTAGTVSVSGGTGGASVTTTVDKSKLDDADRLNTQIKTSGYDPDKLANDAEGINDAYWKTPEYSPTRLLTLYKDNPQLYERTISTAKYGSSLFNSINADTNISDEEKSKLKGDIVQYSKNIYDPNLGLEDIRGNVQSMVNIAKQVGGDKSEDILNNMYKVYSGIYAAKKINTDDPLLTKLSENQALAYKLLQDLQPTEANRYKSIFIDDNDILDNYDAKIQKETAGKRLEELGIQIKKNWAVENVNTYQKEYEVLYNKLKDGTGTEDDYNKALELEAKINPYKDTYTALDNEEQTLSEKYPRAAYLESRNIAQEFVGQEMGGVANILGKTGMGLLNTVKGAWNIIKTPFQTDEKNEIDQAALLGEEAQTGSVLYQTQETAYTKTADYKLSPELQKKVDAINANTSLTQEERIKKATELIYDNPKDVEVKPIEGGKTNISATSLLYGVGNMAAGLAPFLLAEYATGGGATATYASNFMRTFTAAALSSFNQEYAAAIERGSANPYSDAMTSTAIHSAAMAGAGAPDAIRRMLGNKTPIGRLVDKLSDEQILTALRTEPKALGVFKKAYNVGKNVGEAVVGGTKEAAKFVAMTTTGRVVNDAVMNDLKRPEDYVNEGMLEFMNVAVFNSTLGTLGKITKEGGITDITSINKDALHLAAQKPIEFLKLVSDKVKNGTYTPEQGKQITNNIMNANRVLQSNPMLDANGEELSHESQRDLLFLKMQKNDLEATLNKDISKDLASKIGDRLVEIDAKMDKIYKGTLLEPVTVVSKTKNRLSKLTNAVINDAIETGQISKEDADKITDRQSKIDFIEGVANEAQDPAKAQELRKKYGDDVVDHALQLKPIEAKEVKPIADTEITSTFGAASAFIPSKDLETAQTTISKVNNAENINEGEIKTTEDILYTALEKHPEAAHLIEPLITKLQDHEFTTKTETVETTERVPVKGAFAAKRKIETKPALEVTTGSEATVTLADGTTHTGTLEVENGNYVIKAEGKEPVIIGEKQITDRDLKLPSEERVPEPFKMNKDGNLESVSLETRDGHIVEVKGDKALDVAIKLQAEAVGEIPDAAFEQAYQDVVTTNKIEVPVEKPKVEKVEPVETKTAEPTTEGEKKTEPTTKRKTAAEKIKERRERKKQEKKQEELPPTERPQGTRPSEVHTIESIDQADTRGYDNTQKKVIKGGKKILQAVNDIVKQVTGKEAKLVIHSNDASFIKAAEKASGEDQSQLKGKGFYFAGDGTIHVNMVRASKETINHEGFHPLLDFVASNSPQTLSKLYTQLESIGDAKKLIQDVKDTYAGDSETTIQKEAITDFIAKVSDGSIIINPDNFQKIKNFVVKLLNKLGLGLEEAEIMNIKGAKELQDLAQLITGKFGKGEKITAQELRQSVGIDGKELTPTNKTESGYVDANGNPISDGKLEFSLSPQFKDYKGDFKYEYSKDSDKFKKLKEDGYITEDKKISDFDNVTGILHTADHAFTGDIYKGKDKIVSGKGGIFNTVEFHDFGEMWRSTPNAANSMANALNESLKASPDGKARLFLVSSPQDKTLSSSLNSIGMLEILTSKGFDQRVRISEKEMRSGIVTGVENAKKIILDDIYKESVAKTIENLSKKSEENKKPFDLNSRKVQQEIKDNAKKAVNKKKSELPEFTKDDNLKTVQEKLNLFYPPESSTFSDRKTINLRILEGVASKIRSEEGRTQLKDFIETLGGAKLKGKKPSMANLSEGFSNILNEPMLKNTPSRKIYAVIETDGEVQAVDAGGHISYNKAIRTVDPNKKVTIHILQDRPTWTDVTKDPQTGELITPQREKNVLPTNKGMTDVVTISAPKEKEVSFSKEKPLSSQSKLEQDAESRKSEAAREVKVNSEKVQYNGTDAIGSRQRSESEQNASRNEAKEKIKNPETNASLKAANSYNKEAGLPEVTQHKYKPSDPVQQTQAAKLYPKLQDVNSPTYKETDLERRIFTEYKDKYPKIFDQYDIKDYKDLVHKAYAQLIAETQAQYDRLPVKVSFHENGEGNYENNFEMLDDVHNFNHLWVYKGGDDHTELGSKTIDKDGLTANDKFRAVHDYYGHSVEGYQFGKDGEENAWIEHSKMFSPLAQWALSSETRGQNSWVNYSGVNETVLQEIKLGSALKKEGKKLGNQEMIDEGEKLLSTVYDKFVFAEQKAMVLPPQYTDISKFHKEVIKEVPQNLLTYDKANKSRIPSKIGIGEKPVEAKPIEGAGGEKTSTGGNVQTSRDGGKGEGDVKFSKEKEVEVPNVKDFAKQIEPTSSTMKTVAGDTFYNYVNKDGIQVSLKKDEEGGYVNNAEVQADVMIDFIGNDTKRGEGLASKELNRIIKEADKNNMSISLIIDSSQAIRGTKMKKGLSNEELKKWYESKGFIFSEGEGSIYGYRPKSSEDISKFQPEIKKQILIDGVDFEEVRNKFPRLSSIADSWIKTINDKQELIDDINKEYESKRISKIEKDEFLNELDKIKTLEVKPVEDLIAVEKKTELPKQKGEIKLSKENRDDLNEMKDILREYTNQGYSLEDVKEIMKEEFGEDYVGEEAIIEQAYNELTTTSVKNKTTSRERAERGLEEVEVEAKRSFGEAYDKAIKMINDGEVTPSVFAATIANKPRPITAEESVILLKDRMDLSKDYGIKTEQLIDAQDKGDDARATVLRAQLDELEMKMDINDQAAKKSGYELGLGLAARRMLINRDYSLATQLPRLKASAGGKEVPKEYKDKLTTLVKELEKATADLENQERKTLADDVIKQISKIKVVKKPEAEVKKERETIKEKLLNIWNSFTKGKTEEGKVKFAKAPQAVSPRQAQLEAITPEVKKLVKSYAEAGITDIENIIDGVYKDISSVIPGITKEEARDAILGKYKIEPIKAALTPKEIAAKANVDRVKLEIDLLNKKLQLEQRGKGELAMDYLQGWHRFAILSGIPSLGKIGVAATMRGVTSRTEGLIGQALSLIPGIRQIAKGAPREGRINAAAEAKAFTTWFDKMTRKDFRRVMKTGKSEIDILYGNKAEMPEKFPAWMEFFGRMHGAMKLFPKRAEFFRSLEMRTEYAIKNGQDPRDPAVQAELTAAAYSDASRAIFMQDHPLTTAYKRAVDSLANYEVGGISAKPAATALKFLFPIIKVPTNYVAEESSYMIGGLKALTALRHLFKEGGMTSEQKDYFMRALKKQSIGVAFMFLGYLNPQAFGGYYTGKRKEKDLEAGDIELAGVKLPHWMSHSPLLEMLQVGATLRRASDKEVLKGNEPSMVKGIPDVFKGQIKQVPFFGGGERISKSMESGDEAFDYVGGFVKSLAEPQILQNVSDLTTYIQDKKEFGESVKRIPSGFKEQLIEGTPFRGSLEKEKQLFTKEEKEEGILQLLQDKGVDLPFIKQRRKLKVVQDEAHPEGIMSKEEYDIYAEKLNKKVKQKIKETLSADYEIKEGNKYSYKSGKKLEGKDLEDKIKKAEGEASREVLEEMKLLPKDKRTVTKLD
jgi:hypothetical protein